jgi:hypothetical protein
MLENKDHLSIFSNHKGISTVTLNKSPSMSMLNTPPCIFVKLCAIERPNPDPSVDLDSINQPGEIQFNIVFINWILVQAEKITNGDLTIEELHIKNMDEVEVISFIL